VIVAEKRPGSIPFSIPSDCQAKGDSFPMDYAIQLLLPILGGLLLGFWLTQHYGVSPLWTVVLAILGMVGGIGILYKRVSYPELYRDTHRTASKKSDDSEKQTSVPVEKLDFLYREPDAHPSDGDEFKDLDDDP
jgi:F0F1-type ATP synthase assembly protein I